MDNLFGAIKFDGDIPKLTKSNSTSIQGRAVWITKKDENGKMSKTYIAYDYLTKVKLAVHVNGKEALIAYLEKQDFTKINGVGNEKN